jgi:hypothetical protein
MAVVVVWKKHLWWIISKSKKKKKAFVVDHMEGKKRLISPKNKHVNRFSVRRVALGVVGG